MTLLLVSYAPLAAGHSPLSADLETRMAAAVSGLLMLALCALYASGALRKRPGWQRGMAFALSMLLAFYAVLGPLDHWAEHSSAWHMVQHMLFMVVIAPLFVLARPLPQLVAAGGKAVIRCWSPLLVVASRPLLAAYLHGLVVWFWHVPRFYNLALAHPWWHVIEHASFLLTAGLFWWAVLKSGVRKVHWVLFALLFTLVHTGFLGAMLTFAQQPLYAEGRSLADQQLAGLVMWVLGAVPYLLASAWVGYRWYRQVQRRLDSGDEHPR